LDADPVNVCWISLHEDVPSRGFWDQEILEVVFRNDLFPVGKYEFVHNDGFIEADGVIVVVPARSHVHDVSYINEKLQMYRWVLLFLTGDEESSFPRHLLSHPNMKVWVQTPESIGENERALPDFWPPQCRELLAKDYPPMVRWFYSGQVNNPKRRECVEALVKDGNGILNITGGFAQGMDYRTYMKLIQTARVVPCPSGCFTPDSFRVFETLEAGRIPIVDRTGPVRDSDYWALLGGVPFPVVDSWQDFPAIVDSLIADWPDSANKVFAWWQRYKRDLAVRFTEDLQALSGEAPKTNGITAIIPTSLIPSHPDTSIIEQTIHSIREGLPDSEIIVMIDGLHESQQDRKAEYSEYVYRLLHFCNQQKVLPVLFDEYLHQSGKTKAVLELVRTPLVLFVEHDTPLVGEIPFSELAKVILDGHANLIRLYHYDQVPKEHRYLFLDSHPRLVGGVPLMRQADWSQRPHLALTDFYRKVMHTYFGKDSRAFIEHVMYGVVKTNYKERGIEGWEDFRLWLYTPEGDMTRSTHLDGRSGNEHSPESFAYDGEPPFGAPAP
jgi:hypothetical protein